MLTGEWSYLWLKEHTIHTGEYAIHLYKWQFNHSYPPVGTSLVKFEDQNNTC